MTESAKAANLDLKPNFHWDEVSSIVDKSNAVIQKFDIANEILSFPLIAYPERVYVIEEEIIKTSGGLYVPSSARKDGEMQTNIGWVVAVGEGVDFCQPGDRIFYGRYAGAWVMEQKYRVMNEKDILGRYK